jgi:hypothetical protein
MGQPDIYEYYSAETGEPPPTAAISGDRAIQATREVEVLPSGGWNDGAR